jgi:hypothetical protein
MLWIKFDSGPLVCSFLSCCSLKIRRVEIISVAGGKLFSQGDDTVPPVTIFDCVTELQLRIHSEGNEF